MPAFRIVIMLKPGVLDAAGQAVQRGLAALGYDVLGVRVGKVIEIDASGATREAVDDMCARFLANPLIETWQIEEAAGAAARAAGGGA